MRFALAILLAASPVAAEPLFAVSDETLVARSVVGPSWGGDDTGAVLRLGTLVNRHIFAADLDLGFANTNDSTAWSALPSAGLKLKFLSTPENMGYTYVYAGARLHRIAGETTAAPCFGVRDFITYDIVRPWAFALEWQAAVTVDDGEASLDGGIAIGIARAEETPQNFALLVGWRRDRIATPMTSVHADSAFVTLSHQWR